MPSLETSKDSYWFELWLLEKALSSHVSMIGINNQQRYELMIPAGVRQFENEMITEDIMHILDKYALEGDQLIFKIINPLQVNQETQFIKSLIDLQSYGIKLAVDISKIDDNLYYLLNEYKIDILLIDHLLLTTNHDKQIEVEELINFVKANQLEMIVTGIQEKQQLSKLDDEIVKIQGPLLSVPLSKDQILNHLNKRLEI
jgi:EAL domain-containing protein (putative c-di-GMP-specific phosphodiesterase class I)